MHAEWQLDCLGGSESSESSSALDESSESEEDTGNLTGGGLEEILQAFAKRYVRILEDGKALEKVYRLVR